jgi:methylmalonyl-CoA/ethylmalonyl-CoA epimerase
MKRILWLIVIWALFTGAGKEPGLPDFYTHVDQVLWVVSDLENVIAQYEELGFSQVRDFEKTDVISETTGRKTTVKLARAWLGGAVVNWIQPLKGNSLFTLFHDRYGDGAMSLVHRVPDGTDLEDEVLRLGGLGVGILDRLTLRTKSGDLHFVLMDTEPEGKYILGFTPGEGEFEMPGEFSGENRHHMKLNQYAFAIRDPEPVSRFWHNLGQPEFQISHPELGDTRYYGKPADHQLIQGWQRHGSIDYEWCIPVKPPIVYEDHIQKHGEGIHHLAFTVNDMDEVLDDFRSRGFVVSMGGTWGETGKPGSGRYEYIDLENAGGVTMELLWNYKD